MISFTLFPLACCHFNEWLQNRHTRCSFNMDEGCEVIAIHITINNRYKYTYSDTYFIFPLEKAHNIIEF